MAILKAFFISTLFLALVSSGLAYHHEQDPEQKLEQCEQSCQTGQHGQQQMQQCRRQCVQKMSQPELQQICQQRCQMQGTGSHEQCQTRCMQQLEQGEMTPMTRDPEQKLEQCQQSCQSRQCRRQCTQQLSQQERKQICQQRCQMQDSGSQCQMRCMQQLEEGEMNPMIRDPEEKLEQCQQSCQSRECRRQCAQQLSQQERQQLCRQRCQMQDSGAQCQMRCMQQLEQGEMNPMIRDPEQKLEQCEQSCQSQQHDQQQMQQCRRQCAQQLSQEERQQICQQRCQIRQRGGDQQQQHMCQRKCMQQLEQGQMGQSLNYQSQGQSQMKNPYFFPSDMFQQKFMSQEGGMYILEKFTSRQNNLLKGIRNYRLAILEAKANTFVLPHHCDAESIYVVINGRCTCTMMMQDNKEFFNLEKGDVIRVPAGAMVYFVNNNEQTLRVAKLKQPVNTPGRYEDFFPSSSQNIESYLNAFSDDILESAFNTTSGELQRVFGQQAHQQQQSRQGMVIRASKEQLQALSHHASSSPKGGRQSSRGPFNLPSQKPTLANEFGRLFEARPEKFEQLQDMDVAVSCLEINNDAMLLPNYNSKIIFVTMVVEGSGRIEMACPHMASQSQMGDEEQEQMGEQGGRYMKVTADVSEGDVFVIPAGHPVTIVAQNKNDRQNPGLKMLGFGINAQNNKRNFIAGQEANPIREMERVAKQLTFGQEMEQIINRQKQSYFGPVQRGRQQQQQQGEGRDLPLSSILEFAGF